MRARGAAMRGVVAGLRAGLLACALPLPLAAPASASPSLPAGFADATVASGLDLPTGFAFLPDGRLLVVEQKTAQIELVDPADGSVSTVGTVDDIRIDGLERGLLGIAVDPGWPARPYVYVHGNDGSTPFVRVSRYTLDGVRTGRGALALDLASRYDVIADVPDDNPNHNGGTVRFGPDGMLYAGFGEDEARCMAQDTVSLHGVILRLDVRRIPDGAGGPAPKGLIAAAGNPFAAHPDSNARLVWAFGLRNPFRFHIDPVTGHLFVGDVGEARWEEVDEVPDGGHDFGWPVREGPEPFQDYACTPGQGDPQEYPGDPPIYSYFRPTVTAVVIDVGPYRRPAGASHPFPASYEGDEFLCDYYQGFVRRLTRSSSDWSIAPPDSGQNDPDNWATGVFHASDWLVGPDGCMWWCQQTDDAMDNVSGAIHRIIPPATHDTLPVLEPGSIALDPPMPTPSRGQAALRYVTPEGARARLLVFDTFGRRVRSLPAESGAQTVVWDGTADNGRRLPAGLYVVRLEIDGRVAAERRLMLLR